MCRTNICIRCAASNAAAPLHCDRRGCYNMICKACARKPEAATRVELLPCAGSGCGKRFCNGCLFPAQLQLDVDWTSPIDRDYPRPFARPVRPGPRLCYDGCGGRACLNCDVVACAACADGALGFEPHTNGLCRACRAERRLLVGRIVVRRAPRGFVLGPGTGGTLSALIGAYLG